MPRPAPLRPTAVALIVVRDAGDAARVLVMRRRGGAFAGVWNLVTGMIEERESAVDAALRELREETALEATAVYTAERLDAFYDPTTDAVHVVPIFVAIVAPHSAVTLDASHDAHEWLPFHEAAERLEFAIHRDAVRAVATTIVANDPAPWRRFR